jgi:RimJ/RimL family protein N-acetyltransferase
MLELRPLSLEDMEQIRIWREGVRETLRTPYMLTKEMQEDYYRSTICNRDSKTRYWSLVTKRVTCAYGSAPVESFVLVGYGGIENIHHENGNGEISLLIGPQYRKNGYGLEAVRLFLTEAFDNMRLYSVYGECYESSPAVAFWKKCVAEFNGLSTELPFRKFYGGKHWGSYYFTFTRDTWRRA